LLEEGNINLQEKKKIAVILPAPKMRSNMDTKQVAQRSSLEALQRVEKEKKEAIILPAPKMREQHGYKTSCAKVLSRSASKSRKRKKGSHHLTCA
jgi:hypothetical protein